MGLGREPLSNGPHEAIFEARTLLNCDEIFHTNSLPLLLRYSTLYYSSVILFFTQLSRAISRCFLKYFLVFIDVSLLRISSCYGRRANIKPICMLVTAKALYILTKNCLLLRGNYQRSSPNECICTHQKHYARGRINHRCINS